jgi:hypothetical protein
MSATAESLPKRRGVKVGTVHSGSFKKGYDPRRSVPAERRNLLQEVSIAASGHATDAIEFLAKVYANGEEEMKFRLQAASMLLDRGVGSAVSMQVHRQIVEPSSGQIGGQNGQIPALGSSSSSPLGAGVSDQELIQFLKPHLADQGQAIEEGEFEEA